MDDIRKKLQEELVSADWRVLRTQAGRDRVILVERGLDLVEVAWCLAQDRSAEVAGWIAVGRVRKPGAEELAAWERTLATPFRMLIVAPYVLIQEA